MKCRHGTTCLVDTMKLLAKDEKGEKTDSSDDEDWDQSADD